ncbi:MAG TPA: DUF1998 domain-containing protein [Planctomycetaceae bacterium]|nr:DUF1998 domain-containing protein [Planctomycetaceae bacterium]
MMQRGTAKPHGELRQSQVVTTFGPGAMLDLPNHSVLVSGLDFWSRGGEEIVEPRLIAKLIQIVGVPALRLYTPPPKQDDPTASPTWIDVFQFPEWFITQDVDPQDAATTTRSRMLVHRLALHRGKFIDHNRKRRSVVPVRFVRACRNGHIADIDWYGFVHGGQTECRRQLWVDERGTSGDLSEVWIRCECGRERSMAQAAQLQNRALGHCDGSRPWLGPRMREQCGEPNRLLIRTASNAYFPQTMTVISLPDRDETVRQAIDAVWEFLEAAENEADVARERKKAKVKAALEGVSDKEAWDEVRSRRGETAKEDRPVKVAEIETLIATQEELGEDRPDGKFFARKLPHAAWNQPWMSSITNVVLVHRLREVIAQVGFTRFESAAPDIEGELEIGVRRAELAREVTWLPAVENKGEGLFLQFSSTAIEQWSQHPQVKIRGQLLEAGFRAWTGEHQGTHRRFPGLPFLMLHSFSHLLITAVSLECGYPASSIRERIYALPGIGYGILLYTGTSDAEGTLGGLIQVGRRIHQHVWNALEIGELCSNDPVCAQHDPHNPHEKRFLHGAACHGCLLIAETSCEQHNDFLDRALVVPTVDHLGTEFFKAPVT